MSDTIVKVEGLGKRYTISHERQSGYVALRDVVANKIKKIGGSTKQSFVAKEDFWALNDVSFEIKRGEAIGVIGRNGAGKSTLLKILSRITEPTRGRIELNGRIASLLEVGTGFHPELTGRENIFLNGAILGMARAEIKKKFDEIVDFSGVEKFLDTPVKRYSSGMYVRLAFAVAAHLEPEILVVDEVLAVGDNEFQQKCLGKMEDVSKNQGRTVIFVSHNMGTVEQLCSKCIMLNKGEVVKYDDTNVVIDYYINKSNLRQEGYISTRVNKDMTIQQIFTQNTGQEKATSFTHLQGIEIITTIFINDWVKGAELRLVVKDVKGKAIFTSDIELNKHDFKTKRVRAVAEIPGNFLRPGNYVITIATFVHNQIVIDLLEDVLNFDVRDGGSKYAATEGLDYGYIFYDPKWSLQDFN